jgi:hypothetical protein
LALRPALFGAPALRPAHPMRVAAMAAAAGVLLRPEVAEAPRAAEGTPRPAVAVAPRAAVGPLRPEAAAREAAARPSAS